MGGFDKPWRFRIVAENISQLANGHFEDTFSNKGSRPHCIEKFVFCDELARVPKQVMQNCESFRSEFYGLWAVPEAFVGKVQPKGIEKDAFFVRHCVPKLRKFHQRIMTPIL